LEDTWFVAVFHSTPMHDPGLKEVQSPARVCVCKGASALPCLLSCCCWRRRPPAAELQVISDKSCVWRVALALDVLCTFECVFSFFILSMCYALLLLK